MKKLVEAAMMLPSLPVSFSTARVSPCRQANTLLVWPIRPRLRCHSNSEADAPSEQNTGPQTTTRARCKENASSPSCSRVRTLRQCWLEQNKQRDEVG